VIDAMGALVIELRSDSGVAAIVGSLNHQVKVWGEDKPGYLPADPRPYVLIHYLSINREKRTPVQKVRVAVTCVGKDHVQASAVYNAVSDAVHNKGPREHGTLGIWRSDEEIGGQPLVDPETHWPSKTAIYECWASTVAVA
jgi:hypothetical protein